MSDVELHESLLSFIRTASPAPTAPTLIDDYVRTNSSAAQGDVRRAMMALISSGKIVVGSGPRWPIVVKG